MESFDISGRFFVHPFALIAVTFVAFVLLMTMMAIEAPKQNGRVWNRKVALASAPLVLSLAFSLVNTLTIANLSKDLKSHFGIISYETGRDYISMSSDASWLLGGVTVERDGSSVLYETVTFHRQGNLIDAEFSHPVEENGK